MSKLVTAFRNLMASPKPTEPTGLGAMVRDTKGVLWILLADGWYNTTQGKYEYYANLHNIEIVYNGLSRPARERSE